MALKKKELPDNNKGRNISLRPSENPIMLVMATDVLVPSMVNSGQLPLATDLTQEWRDIHDRVKHFGVRYTTNAIVVIKSPYPEVQGTMMMLHEWADYIERSRSDSLGPRAKSNEDDEDGE